MAIRYIGDPPSAEGHYLVREDGALTVAEWDGKDHWQQLGIDYDVWHYSSDVYEIQVICQLHLPEIAFAASD